MAHDHWQDGSAYEGYVGRWSRRVAERFVPWVGVDRGATWVDVGCGTGVLTRAIAELASPASVVGIDPSRAFLRTARAGLRDSRVEFIEGSGGALPVADESSAAVVSGLVLNFIQDVDAALLDMRRVARREGTVAGYVWDYAGEMQLLRTFWDAATELDPAAADLDEGVRFALCRPEALERAFASAGLDEVEVAGIEVPTVFRDFDDYWTPFLSGVGPAPGYVASLDDEARGRLRDRLAETLPREPDGTIELIARAWAVRGIA
jgi:SAM-dependent methyltransferase